MSLTLAQEMLNVKLNKKISIFPLGGPPIGSGQNAHLVNWGSSLPSRDSTATWPK